MRPLVSVSQWEFQHTAARRRLAPAPPGTTAKTCFNTQPPEGGWIFTAHRIILIFRFNTQPPEGGWDCFVVVLGERDCFNTQPPEGGWPF